MTLMSQLKKNPRVEIVDDERSMGNGIIITLKQGWSFDPMQDNRVAGADTIIEAVRLPEIARAYSGPYDD